MDAEDLLDMSDETISHVRFRSRSRDVRGQRVTYLGGTDIPYNGPTR